MDEETLTLREQIARCRRIASYLTDAELRHSLEVLARDYEAQLPEQPFMLRTRPEQRP